MRLLGLAPRNKHSTVASHRRGGVSVGWTSQQVRHGLVQSLQPLQQDFPHIVPTTTTIATTTNNNNLSHYYRYASVSPLAAISTMTTTATTVTSGVSFWKFLLIFTAGGLFFSTALAVAATVYGMGVDNIKRFVQVFLLVAGRVWETFVVGLGVARRTLLGLEDEEKEEDETMEKASEKEEVDEKTDTTTAAQPSQAASSDMVTSRKKKTVDEKKKGERKPWKWRDAWAVLKEQLGETRRKATEGVQALRQEATLYAAAVGQPGLMPLQYAITKLMPYSFSTILEESLRDAMREVKPTKSIKKLKLTGFSPGSVNPILEGARIYDVDDCMAFDFDVKWDSQLEAEIQVYTVGGFIVLPISINNLCFEGVMRLILTPLTKQPPGYGAMLLSFVSPPRMSLNVKVLGREITKVPFLRTEITQMMQQAVADNLLWPRRNIIPVKTEGVVASGPFGNTDGYGPLLNRQELAKLEEYDPLLSVEQKLANSDQSLVREVNEKRLQLNNPGQRVMEIVVDDTDNKNNSTDTATSTSAKGNRGVGTKKRIGIEGFLHATDINSNATSIGMNGKFDESQKSAVSSTWWQRAKKSFRRGDEKRRNVDSHGSSFV